MRFGLIGYGLWGRHHATAIRKAPGAVLAAIACRSEATAALARRDFPGVPVHLDYRELLARPDVDVADVVVPNHLHEEIGVAALEQGKDVLLEKPMAATAAQCDRLLAAARRSGRILSIGHELRLSTQWGSVKAIIDAGDIGEPMYALHTLFRFPYRPGAEGWRHDRSRVGSWILEEPVHAFDSLMWYLERHGDPVSVLALGNGGSSGRPAETGMEDNFTALLRFRGGAYAVVTETLAAFEYHHLTEVVGREGAVRAWWSGTLDRTRRPAFELKVKRRGAAEAETVALAASGELFELEAQLAQAVVAFRERRPLVSGEEARKRVIVCVEAERALREGREIPLAF
jgi:myo-inositol 2-dehydrogenase / D-chiro-inositol 1-dehydrogenase